MKGKSRKIVFIIITGIIIGFLYSGGYILDRYDSLDFLDPFFYCKWALYSFLAAAVICLVWRLAFYCRFKNIPDMRIPLWLCMLIMIICWIPAWLSVFPGAFSYDAYEEWRLVRDGTLTAHHPLIHVLLVGNLVEIFYHLTGNYNVGVAVYTVLQMIILAFVFARTIFFMKELKISGVFQAIALAFYSLSPVAQLFSICTTKDVYFTASELAFFMIVLRFCIHTKECFSEKKRLLELAALAFLTMILRNNGVYIAGGTLIILFLLFRRYWKKLLCVCLAVFALYGLYTGPVYDLLQVQPAGIKEMLSVPIQQMARVYRFERESLKQEDLDILYRVIPRESLEAYTPTVSDPVKNGFDQGAFQDNLKEILGIWLKWGTEHPLIYVNSFLVNTVDFWYPNAVIDGYRNLGDKSSYFDLKASEPATERVLWKGARKYYEAVSWDKEAQRRPFAFLLLSPGWYLGITIVIFFSFWCYRKYRLMIPMWILILHFGTVLLGPMALVRYVLIFFFSFPLLLALFCSRESDEGVKEERLC